MLCLWFRLFLYSLCDNSRVDFGQFSCFLTIVNFSFDSTLSWRNWICDIAVSVYRSQSYEIIISIFTATLLYIENINIFLLITVPHFQVLIFISDCMLDVLQNYGHNSPILLTTLNLSYITLDLYVVLLFLAKLRITFLYTILWLLLKLYTCFRNHFWYFLDNIQLHIDLWRFFF